MPEIIETFIAIFCFLLFGGIWIGFLYLIARFLIEQYEKKPLEYISVNNEESNITKDDKNMKAVKEHHIVNFIIGFVVVVVIVWFIFSFLKDLNPSPVNYYQGATPKELNAIEEVNGSRDNYGR